MGVKRQRLARRRKSLGYSQEQLAERLGVERSTVVRWERGTTDPQPWVRPEMLTVLDLSAEELDELLAGEESVRVDAAGHAGKGSRDTGDGVLRAVLGRAPGSFSSTTFPALHLDELKHIALAMEDARRYADHSAVDYFSKQIAQCTSEDGVRGPRRTLPSVLGVIAAIEQTARDAKPLVRKQLLSVGAGSAEFAGWLYRDIGSPVMAAHWRDRAIEWAQEAGHFPMQGYVLLRKSQAAWDDRDASRMLTLTHAAQQGPWGLPPRVRAEAAQQEARALAMLGDDLDRVERELDEARREFFEETADDADAEHDLNKHYSPTLLALQTAICYEMAGQFARAVDAYRSALAREAFSYRDYGYFLSLMAGALAAAGEPDEAATIGTEALSVALATHSTRTTSELTRLRDQLRSWPQRPAVRDFREAFSLV